MSADASLLKNGTIVYYHHVHSTTTNNLETSSDSIKATSAELAQGTTASKQSSRGGCYTVAVMGTTTCGADTYVENGNVYCRKGHTLDTSGQNTSGNGACNMPVSTGKVAYYKLGCGKSSGQLIKAEIKY